MGSHEDHLGGRAGPEEARMRMVQVLCLCAVAESESENFENFAECKFSFVERIDGCQDHSRQFNTIQDNSRLLKLNILGESSAHIRSYQAPSPESRGLHKLEAVHGIDANREGQTRTWRSGAECVSAAPISGRNMRNMRNRFDKRQTDSHHD